MGLYRLGLVKYKACLWFAHESIPAQIGLGLENGPGEIFIPNTKALGAFWTSGNTELKCSSDKACLVPLNGWPSSPSGSSHVMTNGLPHLHT